MVATVYDMNIVKLVEQFSNEDDCRTYLEGLRWPNGIACLHCGNTSISRLKKRDQLDCNACRYRFSVTTGTVLHDTHLPLWKWFLATYMMIESKKGVSANQLHRSLRVAYRTAWYLCHRIRAAMTEINPPLLTGAVEVDETWVGGKKPGVGRGRRDNKTMVIGALERGGNVRMRKGGKASRAELHGFIRSSVHPDDTYAIYTDDWFAYRGIGDTNTQHITVNHHAKEYVRGAAHTNGIENVWSLLERSVMGAFHHVSEKHLDRYLDELEWRFNNRENPYLFRDTLIKLLASGNLEYRELVAQQ